MYSKYNAVLRWHTGVAVLQSQCQAWGIDGSSYATTIHAINSLVIKGSKLMVAAAVYRGFAGARLPDTFWVRAAFR
jgi:hypothetical protein